MWLKWSMHMIIKTMWKTVKILNLSIQNLVKHIYINVINSSYKISLKESMPTASKPSTQNIIYLCKILLK